MPALRVSGQRRRRTRIARISSTSEPSCWSCSRHGRPRLASRAIRVSPAILAEHRAETEAGLEPGAWDAAGAAGTEWITAAASARSRSLGSRGRCSPRVSSYPRAPQQWPQASHRASCCCLDRRRERASASCLAGDAPYAARRRRALPADLLVPVRKRDLPRCDPPRPTALGEAANELEGGVGDLAPAAVDGQRVSSAWDLGDLGNALVVLLALVRRVRDRPGNRMVLVAADD